MGDPGSLSKKRGEQYYSLNRDAKETARLHLQHALLTRSFTFLLHPYITHNIPLSTPGLRIADFGTGTGIFPLSLAPLLHPSSTIIGFDISAAQFPLLESLPQNIQLQEHDILVRLPEKYEGCFDIIAVRALVTALADKEWDVAVGNLVRYLKPGGMLQWLDPDLSPRSVKVVTTIPSATPRFFYPDPSPLQRGVDTLFTWAKHLDRDLSSSSTLPALFASHGLENILHEEIPYDNDPSTRKELSVEMNTAYAALFLRFARMEGSALTLEEGKEIGRGMVGDAERGERWLRMDFWGAVGRKGKREGADGE